ncbi:hypothetical protein KJ903_04915 [Patescibacteria group bacterium]|nr:hypothetical protein [Patescibacteria group bacterium]
MPWGIGLRVAPHLASGMIPHRAQQRTAGDWASATLAGGAGNPALPGNQQGEIATKQKKRRFSFSLLVGWSFLFKLQVFVLYLNKVKK